MFPVTPPQIPYTDLDGNPLESGYLYFGVVNLNPETNPTTVYWDEAGAIPAAQPIRTVNGHPSRSGNPATVYAAGDHSVTVRDSLLRLVSYQPESLDLQRQTSAALSSLTYENTRYAACTSRTVQARLEDRTSLRDFGAAGDGVTDDTAAIQAAISSGAPLLDGDGLTYLVTATLTGVSNQHLRNMVLDVTGLGATSFALSFSGTSSAATLLTVDGTAGATALTVASTAGLSADQWCIISSADLWSPAALDNVTCGEYVRIEEITGPNDATLYGALLQTYAVAATGTLTPVNPCRNVVLENIRLIGPVSVNDQKGIKIDRCADFRIVDCFTEDFDHTHIQVEQSVNCVVRGCRMSRTGAQESLDYGVIFLDGCYNCAVEGCTVEAARHVVSIEGTSGVSRFIRVTGCHGQGLTDAGIFTNAAVHEHDFSHNSLSFSSAVDATKDGITSSGGQPTITDNTVYAPGRNGVSWYPRINAAMAQSVACTIRGLKGFGISVIPGTTACVDIASPDIAGACRGIDAILVDDVVSSAFGIVVRVTANQSVGIDNVSVLNCKSIFAHTTGGVVIDAPSTKGIGPVFVSGNELLVAPGGDSCISITGCATASIGSIRVANNCTFGADYGLRLSYCSNVSTNGNMFLLSGTAPRISGNTVAYDGNDAALAMSSSDTMASLTIAGDTVTIPNPIIRELLLGGEGGAADDLDTINGGYHGQVLMVRGDGVNPVTVKHSAGNIDCGADRILSHVADTIALVYNATGAAWYMLSYADNT